MTSLVQALRIPADVIYINQYHDVLFASTIARLKRLPLVCHLRLFPPEQLCGQWRIGLSAVTRFISVSQATRDAYIGAGFAPDAIEVVLNGIDVTRFRPLPGRDELRASLGLAPNDFAVLFVGRIDRGKNLEGLLQSFALLRKETPRARLLIAGRPLNHGGAANGARYLQALRELAGSLGITDSVQWLGPRSDVVELYSAADVCALFSIHPETFGRTVAEAMACGAPAVATAIGGMPEVMLGEFAHSMFAAGDVVAGANRLRALLDWQERDPHLGERARDLVTRHFDARRMAHEVTGILEKAVAEGAVRRGPRWLRAEPPRAAVTSGAEVVDSEDYGLAPTKRA